jgi:hypothetical protein
MKKRESKSREEKIKELVRSSPPPPSGQLFPDGCTYFKEPHFFGHP